MLFKKILLSSALISMAGFVACGDDSSSNSGTKDLPKSVPTFFDLEDVECNADRKCETIIVEDGPDTYECDGVSQWNMLINSMPSKVCPAKEEEKKDDEEEEEETENNEKKNGEVFSCNMEIMGMTSTCDEATKGSTAAQSLEASCKSVEGFLTATPGTGCPENFTKKCDFKDDVTSYFYEEANADQDCADLIKEN